MKPGKSNDGMPGVFFCLFQKGRFLDLRDKEDKERYSHWKKFVIDDTKSF
jgi:hypothetical protein